MRQTVGSGNATTDSGDRGLYVLWFHIPQQVAVAVGALGELTFVAGRYAYVGSAQRGRQARINRHLKIEKPKHWHMDYVRPHAVIDEVTLHAGTRDDECRLVTRMLETPGVRRYHPSFGASDCRCGGHLLWITET